MQTYSEHIHAAAHAPLPWHELEGMSILVTGATGLIGGCLVDILMSRPHTYIIYAAGRNVQRAKQRFARYAADDTLRFISFDVTEPLAADIRFDYIVHAASNASPVFFASSPVEVMKANVYGVANLIDYGRTHSMRRFLYVSTGEVYGQGEGELSETDSGYVDCATPRACYPSSKRAAETLCVAYGAEYGVDTVIVRPCHTYGPYFTDSDNRVFCQFIRNVLRGEDIVMKSDGSQMRSWCYVADCALAILYALLKGESGNAYNIADSTSVFSIRHLAETIAGAAGRRVVLQLPDDAERKGFSVVRHAVFNTQKLQGLGWSVSGTWQDKLAATVAEEQLRSQHGQSIDK